MLTEPKIVEKAAQPFAAILLTLRQPEIAAQAPPLVEDVIAWVIGKGLEPSAASFFNYVSFLPDGVMEMQVGVPTATVLPADGRFITGTLPDGRYASITATVPYHELHDANMQLDSWVRGQGLELDGMAEGERLLGANRMEIYHQDQGEDPSGYPVTEIAFRLR